MVKFMKLARKLSPTDGKFRAALRNGVGKFESAGRSFLHRKKRMP